MGFTNIVYPCRNCIYFEACGDKERTVPCKGRVTKRQKQAEDKNK